MKIFAESDEESFSAYANTLQPVLHGDAWKREGQAQLTQTADDASKYLTVVREITMTCTPYVMNISIIEMKIIIAWMRNILLTLPEALKNLDLNIQRVSDTAQSLLMNATISESLLFIEKWFKNANKTNSDWIVTSAEIQEMFSQCLEPFNLLFSEKQAQLNEISLIFDRNKGMRHQ